MTTVTKTEFDKRVKQMLAQREKVLNINSYIADGFEKVCNVENFGSHWRYKNINQDLMYSSHNSWVYFVVENNTIVKCGETGNPLGIKEKRGWATGEIQPITTSECRFGRLRRGDGTDNYIRSQLYKSIQAGNKVSLWAKKCKLHVLNESLGGIIREVDTSIHKSLEQMYLQHFKQHAGHLPLLNKSTK